MADRSRLHISKIDAFAEWLKKDGWKLEETKGAFEVLRARKDGRKNPLIVYTKLEAKEHLSVMDRDRGVLGAFLKSTKELPNKQQTNADRIRAMSDEDLAMVIICPYDTAGEPDEIMPCVERTGQSEVVAVKDCVRCCREWLQKEVRVVDGERGTDAVPETEKGSREPRKTD